MEIYIEPQLSQPQLIAIGHLATTEALSRLGNALGYPVTVMGLDVTPERFPDAAHTMDHIDFSHIKVTPHTYIVVATHGNYDEQALEAALRTEAPYVALIASKSRAEATLQYLHDSDLTAEQVRRLKFPAGLDFGAVTPEEIALSILAEIIQLRRRPTSPPEPTSSHDHGAHTPAMQTDTQLEPGEARDPVCGMTVEIAAAHFTSEYEDVMYYFCAAGCKRAFEAEPEKYLIKE